MNEIGISIIIPVKNEERRLDAVLKGVFSQEISSKIEVIIIDSGSQDSTLEIAARYPLKILEIPAQEFGHGKTRNQGARIASGKIAVFLNADAVPGNQNWLNYLVDNFKGDERIAGVYSCIYPQPDCNPLRSWEILNDASYHNNGRQIKYIKNPDDYRHMNPGNKRRLAAFQTISCAIRKEILLKYPFKDMEFGEDLEWSKRIIEEGFRIVFEPASCVIHSHNFYFSFRKTMKKYFDDARINNELFNIWSGGNFLILPRHILFKVYRDSRHILALHKSALYKVSWLFYSPLIRLAELLGIILGAKSRYLPYKWQNRLSLAREIRES